MPRPHRRRAHKPPAAEGAVMTAPAAPPATPAVSLRSQKSIDKLLRDLQDADRRARDAEANRAKAIADADRIAQSIADLNRREDEIRNELDLIVRKRTELHTHENNARTYADSQRCEGAAAADEATDSRALLDAAGVQVDPNLLVPMSPNGTGPLPVPPTTPLVEVDPTADDPRMDGPLSRWHEAHDEQDAAEGGQQ